MSWSLLDYLADTRQQMIQKNVIFQHQYKASRFEFEAFSHFV